MQDKNSSKLNLSILYVEDDLDILENVTNFLERRVQMVFPAKNGKEGLAIYKEKLPDLVITDIRMPEMDGIQLSQEIKAINAEALIIIMSAFSDIEYLMNSINIGVSQYILKPMDFNKLFYSIQKSYSLIQLRRDYENQRLELIQAKDRAVLLTKLKDRFVRLVAHDLKSPLNSILELLDLLSQSENLQKDQEMIELVQGIKIKTKEQISIIETLLSKERLSSLDSICKPSTTNVFSLTNLAIESMKELAQKKNIKIENQIPPSLSLVLDPELIQEVFKNLISNSIKYSNPSCSITISFDPTSKSLVVNDNGIGIPEDVLNKLFSENIESLPGTHGEVGSGLGLLFCKNIMDLHKGNLQIESKAGVGTRVSLFFPT